MLGHGHHADQRQHHGAKPAHPAAQELDLRLVPAEVDFRHATRGEDAVGGVEHQPGLGQLPERRAKVGILPAGVNLQGVAAQGQAQAYRHRQEDVDQDCLGRMPLAVTAEVADVLVHFAKSLIQVLAAPQQAADHQQQRQEQQRPLAEAVGQFLEARAPGQAGDLVGKSLRYVAQPVPVQRLVAGDPEHLLVEGGAQALGRTQQLLLVELQGDRFVEQCREFAVQALQQVGAGDRHFQQGLAQLRGNVFRWLIGQQLVDVGDRAAHLLALLVDLELVQAGVGDLVGQVAVDLQVRQGLLLLVEDLRQQQAALEHVDLLVQRLVGLGQAVELLLGAQVLLGQLVEAVGAFEQVVGELEVDRALRGQQAAAAYLLGFDRLLGDGLLGLGQALVVDQCLQVLDFLFQACGTFDQQVVTGIAKVLQQAVAGQFLTA
ncbi:hypothetical protein D3C81_1035630 [compost metagenome]